MILGLTLAILLMITLLSIISGGSFISGTTENLIQNELIVNGTESTIEYAPTNLTFGIDPLVGGLIILVVIIALASVIGIRILASGLADTSIATVRTAIMYTGLWTTLSLASAPLIISIELIGAVLYIGLTIVFVIGVFQSITGGTQ